MSRKHEALDIENQITQLSDRIQELRWDYEQGRYPDKDTWQAEMNKAKDKLRYLRNELTELKKGMSG